MLLTVLRGALAAGQAPADCAGVAFSAERAHSAHLNREGRDFLLEQSWTKNRAAWALLTSYFLQVDVAAVSLPSMS